MTQFIKTMKYSCEKMKVQAMRISKKICLLHDGNLENGLNITLKNIKRYDYRGGYLSFF